MNEMITLEGINKRLGKRDILKDISFSVSRGDIFGYLGPNGAGKTTTMRIVLGLLKPGSGKALVNGKDLSRDTDARNRAGVLLDRDGLYDRISARDNLEYYARLYGVSDRRRKIDDMLAFAGLTERKNDRVGNFSKGMKRKLGLARALIHDPEVLFLDEPTAGLDPEAQKMVRDLLLSLSGERNMTIFLNSHDLDEVQRICSKVAIVQDGRIRAFDTVENLRGAPEEMSVRIVLTDSSHAEKARDLLSRCDFASFRSRDDAVTLTAGLARGKKPSDVLSFLVGKGVSVEEITATRQSLEDIYIGIMNQEEK
ncbi:MAG: ABC transporter ATP-binding protein [Dehalococcoidales bacterium]|nr:ABC transporter ATP-binding protein [Dehalococcoidales bacterium]